MLCSGLQGDTAFIITLLPAHALLAARVIVVVVALVARPAALLVKVLAVLPVLAQPQVGVEQGVQLLPLV